MKKTLIILFLFPFFAFGQIKPDKYYHAGAGVAISSTMYTIGQFSSRDMNPIAPSLMAFTGACGKEFYDTMNSGRFSYQDIVWTTVSGIATNLIIRAIWKPKKKFKDPYNYNPELVYK